MSAVLNKQRMVESYRRQRAYLISLLGGKCVDCGEDDPGKLEFGHTSPDLRTWKTKKFNRWTRIAIYGREAFDIDEAGRLINTGRIVLQCGDCNKAARYMTLDAPHTASPEPDF